MTDARPRCFRVHPADNVATLLDDAPAAGGVALLGAAGHEIALPLVRPVRLGHKIALRAIAPGEPVIKFGVPIGRASEPIPAGEWVHLHNCSSLFDERSQSMDVQTGAATDTKYE